MWDNVTVLSPVEKDRRSSLVGRAPDNAEATPCQFAEAEVSTGAAARPRPHYFDLDRPPGSSSNRCLQSRAGTIYCTVYQVPKVWT